MKFGYAPGIRRGAGAAGKANPGIGGPAGLPAEFELGRLTPTGLFLLVGGFRIRFGYLEWRVSCQTIIRMKELIYVELTLLRNEPMPLTIHSFGSPLMRLGMSRTIAVRGTLGL